MRCRPVHNAPMKTPQAPARVRLTISVSPEVHDTFTRMAEAGGMSVSRAMGDWLGDTLDAAEHMATLMERARAAPKIVAREMHSYALGLADETTALMAKLREKGAQDPRGAGAAPAGAGPARSSPPSGNTGGKVPPERRRGGGKSRG